MIGAIKFFSASIIVVAVSAMVLAGGDFDKLFELEQGAAAVVRALDLQNYNAEWLLGFLDKYQPKGCIRGCILNRSQVITVEQTGQLLFVDHLSKQLTSGSTLDCSFETMDRFGKIEIDNVKNKVMRYLLKERFDFVLPRYLARCAPLMHKEVEEFIKESDPNRVEGIANFLHLIKNEKAIYLNAQGYNLDFVKNGATNLHERTYWRTEFDKYGKDAFQTDICTPIEENRILGNIIDVVAGAVENKWTHLSQTEGTSFLKVDSINHYPVCLYLLGQMCKHEKNGSSDQSQM